MRVGRQTWGFWLVAVSSVVAAEPVLKRSDVVFMYQAGRPTLHRKDWSWTAGPSSCPSSACGAC